ncbi:MAG TPA: BamA/TamA family outer membrane protein [Hyphomonadaceae bacterium]|nr:BamA/TamA family outer membrane protein [Hyphomonadaceae bacterium]
MAFGERHRCEAVRVIRLLVAGLCLTAAAPALAQQATTAPQAATPSVQEPLEGNALAGRVPVYGIPQKLQDDFKRLLREEPAPSSLFDARRQAERAATVAATFLESEGYYQAEVEPNAVGVDTFNRFVTVTHGPLFTYSSARIDYLDASPDETTRVELGSLLAPLDTGIPARAQPVIDVGDALVTHLRNAGYPDAKADPVDALADAATGEVELAYKVRPGLRASFGQLNVKGLGATNLAFIEKMRPWKANEQYSPAKMDEFRSRLAETGLFNSAAVKLGDVPSDAAEPGETRSVEVELRERERRTIALGASASTSEGAGFDGEWQLRNLTGWGDTLAVKGQIATLQRRIGTTYTRPHIGKYGRTLALGAKVEDFETDAFDQTGGSVSASLQEILTPRLRAAVGLEAGYASILDSQARILAGGRRNVYLLSGSATAEYVGVRDILDPVNGIRARVAIEPGLTAGDTNIVYGRLSGEASIYSDFGTKDFVGALRGKLGAIIGPNGAPPDKLFFAGGGGSVRGYEYQSISPRDSNNLLVGGRSLIEMSAEMRYRASDTLGYVAFLDAGAAGSNVEPPLDSMSLGTGVGVRYYTAFGPLRADIAVPLNKKEGDADFQIYISIGQAF